MARECDGPVKYAAKNGCPLQCPLRGGADPGADPASARAQVAWAGLPVNLDLVFSSNQRDRVYVQHLLRKRENQLSRWLHDRAHLCVCENAAEDGNHGPDAA